MLRTIKGVYDNGVVKFDGTPPSLERVKVLITFLEEAQPTKPSNRERRAGGLAGQIWMAEDLNDYM